MKKLFIWAYTHNPTFIEVCGLTSDGELLFTIRKEKSEGDPKDYERVKNLLIDYNNGLQKDYLLVFIDQKALEEHIYEGGSRDLLPKDFQMAWDKYKLGDTITN